ncbi:MAG: response regulator [Acidobacteriia bacterium]|nr:response regulator [Terriglobia bacterium]
MMTQKKILVVDDEEPIRALLDETLSENYQVLTARSGEEAIRRAVLEQPNCIFLDVMLPQMGGFMLCEILKSIKPTRLIPIVMMSAKPRRDVWPLVQELGAFEFVEKPFTIDEIRKTVERTLALAPVERRRAQRVRMKIHVLIRGYSYGEKFEVRSDTEDVSRFGALVPLPFKIPVGDLILIRQSFDPYGGIQPDATEARVVWNEGEGGLGPYRHGLEFLRTSPQLVISS